MCFAYLHLPHTVSSFWSLSDSTQDCQDSEALGLDELLVQDPMKMGYLGVKTMVQHLQGEPVESRINTGVTLVTPANLDDPQTQQLIRPPLDAYLN